MGDLGLLTVRALMVYDGRSGAPVHRVPNTSRTASEYPVIVDVTGDGQTNIVVAANNDQLDRDCTGPFADRPDRYPECHEAEPPDWCAQGTRGVFAYQDAEDRWVRTREIWNEFDYHIDNVADDATIPASPDRSWDTHNTFRANRQGEVPLNASDPRVEELRVFVDDCPDRLEIAALISNQGTSERTRSGLPAARLVNMNGVAPQHYSRARGASAHRSTTKSSAARLTTALCSRPVIPRAERPMADPFEVRPSSPARAGRTKTA